MEPTICAWCQKEAGIKPKPHESHGICDKHKKQVEREIKEAAEKRRRK